MTLEELRAEHDRLTHARRAMLDRHTAELAAIEAEQRHISGLLFTAQRDADRADMTRRLAKWPSDVIALLRCAAPPMYRSNAWKLLSRRGLVHLTSAQRERWTSEGDLARSILNEQEKA